MLAAALLSAGASPAIATAGSPQTSVGPIQTLAHVPYPGNPGGVAIDGDTMWVDSSSADSDRPFDGSSSVFAYDLKTGQLLSRTPNPIVVPKLPVATMGLAGMVLDAKGRVYIADMNGQVDRVDPATNAVTVYGAIPTSTSTSFTSMPGFDVFGPDGSLYVGDASAPVIWRIPAGGGKGQPWFVDPRLSGQYGAAVDGLALDRSGKQLYFAAGPEQDVSIYRLPLAHPDASHLQLFHTYTLAPAICADTSHATDPYGEGLLALVGCDGTNSAGAGGIVFGKSGRLYVALLSVSQLSILGSSGEELLRFPDPHQNMQLANPVNSPFNLTLDRFGRLLIADLGNATWGYAPGHGTPPGGLPDDKSWAILATQVHDTPATLFRPRLP